jgi:hypothetical protein
LNIENTFDLLLGNRQPDHYAVFSIKIGVQLHIFQDWCHLKTVEDENDLEDALTSRYHSEFDLDIYKLLQRHLNTCMDVISYERKDEHVCERPRLSMETAGLLRRA